MTEVGFVDLKKGAIVIVDEIVEKKGSPVVYARVREPYGWTKMVDEFGEEILFRKFIPAHYVTTRQLSCIAFLMFLLIFQELILKRILRQPRPGALMQIKNDEGFYAGSCIKSCGMPSSHSALAIGWFTIIFWEAKDNLLFSNAMKANPLMISTEDAKARGPTLQRLWRQVQWLFLEFTPFQPWTSIRGSLSAWAFTGHVIVWTFLLLPVPFARVVLYDHTALQAFFGMVSGFLIACAFKGLVELARSYTQSWQARFIAAANPPDDYDSAHPSRNVEPLTFCGREFGNFG
eukprot:CAMPEP_0169173138 /NCGR_PEP_ID=MMETSP1015-20121227/63760_1 /TAXON_ID=342587 /ORGANISM="Karlodinium micrum, Strain CCMP2283" /LENGTH=289 /DNA_ID=CAMNT_0009246725 /DNA_START=90 /DNA_END=955 /DNA_ORIENTATION=+